MKNYIPTYGDFVNEDILNDPKAKLWDTKFRINYDDLPANMDLRTPYLDNLFKGIPYQHYAFPQVSDDGNLIFKNQRDLDKAKKILSGIHESVVTESKDDYMAKSGNTDINLKKGYKHLVEYELDDLYTELGEISKKYKIKGITATFESAVNEENINLKNISDIDHTRLIKWISQNLYVKSDIDVVRSKDGYTINADKIPSKDKNDLIKYLRHNDYLNESVINEAAAKQFDKDVETLIKDIKRGYGWIEPEYVVDSWDNVSDTISFDLVKGEVLKRLFNVGLLYHSSVNGKDKGAKVTLSELGALALMKESSVNEAEKFKATKDFEEFLEEIDGMPENRIKRIMGSKYIDTPGGFRDEADDYDNDIVEYMISNMGRKEFEKLQAYWETNIKESSTFIAESSIGDVHIMAEEAATFDEFRAEFVKEYGISKKENNKELVDWLTGIWKENHKK